MTTDNSVVDAVLKWLANHFPDTSVEHAGDFDRETHLFRIQPPQGRAPELELSREVLERKSPASVTGTLDREKVAERLTRDPTLRVQFFEDGVRGFETRFVTCDGQQYRIVRDGGHNVAIYDSSDQRLPNAPQQQTVMTTSIFKKDMHTWCDAIRVWRSSG